MRQLQTKSDKLPVQVITDTREQRKLWLFTIRQALVVGDYTTVKLQKRFIVERKSLRDLYGTIIHGHTRFRKQITKAATLKIKMPIFIEGTEVDFYNKNFPGGADRKIKGETLKKIIKSMSRLYALEFVWCGDRDTLKRKLLRRLKLEERKLKRK